METRAEAHPAVETGEHGLKKDAIGFTGGLVIALASTAPAYSLAAVIGSIVVIVGLQAPAALLVAFVPMFFIAAAFNYMNRADQDCGTSFSWVTRAMGPQAGWITGWAICVTGILVIGSLADVATYTFFDLVGLDSLTDDKFVVAFVAVALIAAMTWICILGTELSARVQIILMTIQIGALLLFVGVVLAKVWSGDGPPIAIDPSLSWFNPFEISSGGALTGALLLGVFIYWGWESAVNLNEETENSVTAPGLAALLSTVILLVTYCGVATALIAWRGIDGAQNFDDNEAILGAYADQALGDPLGSLVLLAVVVSALASTQTTILPASRTSLSMARAEAMPSALGRGQLQLLHAGDLDDRDRRPGDLVVRAVEADLGELPLRLALGAGADDRLLLRADRVRLRDLLPPRADQVGERTCCSSALHR